MDLRCLLLRSALAIIVRSCSARAMLRSKNLLSCCSNRRRIWRTCFLELVFRFVALTLEVDCFAATADGGGSGQSSSMVAEKAE